MWCRARCQHALVASGSAPSARLGALTLLPQHRLAHPALERCHHCQVWGDASWQPWVPVPTPWGLWTSEGLNSSHALSWQGGAETTGEGGTVTTELSPTSPEPVLHWGVHSLAGQLSSLLPCITAELHPGASSILNGPTLVPSTPGSHTTLGLRQERGKTGAAHLCRRSAAQGAMEGPLWGRRGPPDPWPPLPPPARPVAAGDMENDGALCALPEPAQRSRARHWRRRATICLYMGKARRPR